MKITTFNVNGIRAAQKKGFLDWLQSHQPDVLCLQETKAQAEQLDDELKAPPGYKTYWHSGEKKGYSSVATFTKHTPQKVIEGIGIPAIDREGRVLQADFGDFYLLNCYFPNSQDFSKRLPYKLEFCAALLKHCKGLVKKGHKVLMCGDYNIAHTEMDLARPKENEENAGFLPEERAWMTEFLKNGFVDTHRLFYQGNGMYTWWTYRTFAKERNIGWRIDYHCVSENLKIKVESNTIFPDVDMSDHCPVDMVLKV